MTDDVDFQARTVAYYGCLGEVYTEDYPAVAIGIGDGKRLQSKLHADHFDKPAANRDWENIFAMFKRQLE